MTSRLLLCIVCCGLGLVSTGLQAQASGDDAGGEDPWGDPVANNEGKAAPKAKGAKSTAKKAQPSARKKAQPREGAEPKSLPERVSIPAADPPAWKNPYVAERSPNRWGQTGIKNITSARPGKSGDVDIGLNFRGFYSPDFLVPGVADSNLFFGSSATFGFSLFDLVEFGLATRVAANENSELDSVAFGVGDLVPSLKVGYGFGPVAFGVDVRLILPASPQSVLHDFQNVSARGLALLTLDLYEAYGIPVRAHLNGGYTFQADRFAPDGPRDLYYANTAPTHLSALAKEQWFYDHVSYGLGLEIPLPFVTPYLEVWGQTSVFVRDDRGVDGQPYNFVTDTHLTVTPGVRISPLQGLSIDVGADIGALGTAGYLQPDLANVVNGQPVNPLWAVQLGVSYTFRPFDTPAAAARRTKAAGTSGRGSTTGGTNAASNARVAGGCVTSTADSTPIEDAIIEFTGTSQPRLATKADGCFRLAGVAPGSNKIEIRHPDYETKSSLVTTDADPTATVIALVPLPREGTFKGFITNEKDRNVDAMIELSREGQDPVMVPAKDGTFTIALKPGSYQAVVKADGYLQQGAKVVVEKSGRTIRNFVLKLIPKKRISELKKGKIAIRTRIPFAYSKARLLRAAEFILDDVVDVILSNGIKKIRIEGHTDNTGDKEYNQQLSEDRASAVRDYLIDKGIPADRLDAKGYGSQKPIARNDRESGRAKNRRVDFVIVDDDGTKASAP